MESKISNHFLWIIAISLLLITSVNAQQLGFPGAEGFGRYTQGGRGGSVYHVTNLNDSGTGSIRDAVSQPYRTVVFDVGGVINISTRIVISHHVTVAGQTAPGGGITIYGNGVAFNGDSGNDIIRYIRIRMGKNGDSGKDAVAISEGQDYLFDHVSISWGRDGTLDVNGTGIDNLTFQDCIISQGINNSNHSTGGLMQSGKWSMIRSLYIDNKTRNPKARGTHECINSVLYNWVSNGYIMGDTDGLSECNLIGNYFIYGPSSSSDTHITRTTSSFHVYAEDNWVDSNKDGTLNGSLMTDYKTATVEASKFAHPGVSQQMSAQDALNHVSKHVGASLVRDAVDELLISQLLSYGTSGSIINTEDDNGISGNVGTVANGTPLADTDKDGMPDSWETANGMNPNSADNNGDIDGDGFTNLEEYLDWIVQNNGTPKLDAFSVIEAESYSNQSGVKTETCSEGGLNVGYINDGDWMAYYDLDFGDGANTFVGRLASTSTGNLEIRLGGPDGELIGTVEVSTTGGWQTWSDFEIEVNEVSGVHDLYLICTGGDGYLFNVNSFYFEPSEPIIQEPAEIMVSGSLSQTVNLGDSIESVFLTWKNADSVGITGLPEGVSVLVGEEEQSVHISGTPSGVGEFSYTVSTAGGVTDSIVSGVIIVRHLIEEQPLSKSPTDQTLSFFPNPVQDRMILDFSGFDDGLRNVRVYNLSGRLIKETSVDGDSYELNVSELGSGIYFLRVKIGQSVLQEKFIKN